MLRTPAVEYEPVTIVQILGERGRSLGDATIFHYCEWLKKVAPSLPDHEKWERRETFTHP
jgi:hypothetical protein